MHVKDVLSEFDVIVTIFFFFFFVQYFNQQTFLYPSVSLLPSASLPDWQYALTELTSI